MARKHKSRYYKNSRLVRKRTGIRMTVNKVKKIIRKIEKKKSECIKLDTYWVVSPSDNTGTYRPIMWIPVDYPLDNSAPSFIEYAQTQVASGWNSVNIPQNDARVTAKCLRGNKCYRQNLKISLSYEMIWYTGTGYGSAFTTLNGIPTITNAPDTINIQNSPNPCHTWVRISLIRAKKNVTDADLETYLATLTGETPNGSFWQSFNSQVCVVAYDKKFRHNDKNNAGINLRIPLKPKTQRQSRSFEVAPGSGLTTHPWITRGKLYLVVMQYHYQFTDSNFTWHFLPRYHLNICEWIRDT